MNIFYNIHDKLKIRIENISWHLIRDLNGDFHKNQLNAELKAIVTQFGGLLRTIVSTIDEYGLRRRHLHKHHKDVNRFYKWLEKVECETEIASQYQRRLIRCKGGCFEFLNHDGVPWNNNNAEKAVKQFVRRRDVMGARFSEDGLRDYLTLLSIYQTLRYRNRSFFEFLLSGETDLEAFCRRSRGLSERASSR